MYLLMAGCTTQISQAAPSSTSSLSSPALVGASTVFQLVVKANMTQASYPSESAEAKAEALTLIGSGHSLEFCSVIQATLGASINIVETIISHIDIYIHTLESWNLIDRLHEDEAASDQGINAVMCALNDERLYVPLIERVLLSHESPTHYTLHQLPTSQPSTTTPLIYAAKHLRSNTAVQYLVNVSLEYDRQVQLEERNRMDWLNVNLQDFEGNTALMYACKFNLNRSAACCQKSRVGEMKNDPYLPHPTPPPP